MKYAFVILVTFLFLGCTSDSGSASSIYKNDCASCHGKDAMTAAFGKSQKIGAWSKDTIKQALIGYKDGSYGGSMKGLMKSAVKSYSASELDALAEYISNINK